MSGKKGGGKADDDKGLSHAVYSTETGDLRKSGQGGSFGGLLAGLGHKSDGTAPSGNAAGKSAGNPPGKTTGPKLTVRLERKGRGGKTVTLVENYKGPGPSAEDLSRALKAHCGTGGSIEPDGAILIQGDQRQRVAEYLRKIGLNPSVSG